MRQCNEIFKSIVQSIRFEFGSYFVKAGKYDQETELIFFLKPVDEEKHSWVYNAIQRVHFYLLDQITTQTRRKSLRADMERSF